MNFEAKLARAVALGAMILGLHGSDRAQQPPVSESQPGLTQSGRDLPCPPGKIEVYTRPKSGQGARAVYRKPTTVFDRTRADLYLLRSTDPRVESMPLESKIKMLVDDLLPDEKICR